MISLAGRDIAHSWSKFVLTGMGLGLLIGVTLTMAGVYRGMVDDAHALLNNSGADLWVVQKDTQGPYAESSSIKDDVVRSVRGMPGVAQAANVTYFTMQVQGGDGDGDGTGVQGRIRQVDFVGSHYRLTVDTPAGSWQLTTTIQPPESGEVIGLIIRPDTAAHYIPLKNT